MKRDALLNAVVALSTVYRCLGHLLRVDSPIEMASAEFESAAPALATLQATANDRTLRAAGNFMQVVSPAFARMAVLRAHISADTATLADLVKEWKRATTEVPPVWADFIESARAELGLRFDRRAFLASVTAVNKLTMTVFDEFVGNEAGTTPPP